MFVAILVVINFGWSWFVITALCSITKKQTRVKSYMNVIAFLLSNCLLHQQKRQLSSGVTVSETVAVRRVLLMTTHYRWRLWVFRDSLLGRRMWIHIKTGQPASKTGWACQGVLARTLRQDWNSAVRLVTFNTRLTLSNPACVACSVCVRLVKFQLRQVLCVWESWE